MKTNKSQGMLFKHPSVLYALFALLIPVIIHLFKLRKFQKKTFTNIVLLEKIKLQSRKSSQLKKWLILLSRLGIFSALIFAFAIPYLPLKSESPPPEHYFIYLDNSFSMQAKGTNGPILQRAIQDIIANFEPNKDFSLFTNNVVFNKVRLPDIQNDFLNITYTSKQLSPEQILLQYKKLSKNISNSSLIVISDFQKKTHYNYETLKQKADQIIQLAPVTTSNASIDSLWITTNNDQKLLNIQASGTSKIKASTISILNKDHLIGKASVDFSKKKQQITQVPLPKNKTIEGIVKIDDPKGLSYDNIRFFSVNEAPKANILVIGTAFYDFLQKIYTKDEFNFSATTISTVNTKAIFNADVIILNEVASFPKNIAQDLTEFTKQGGTLCVIPKAIDNKNLTSFLDLNFNIRLRKYTKTVKKLNQINFQHPLFNNVFTKSIDNFQYPTIKESYEINSKNWILGLQDNTSFLIQENNTFVFSAPLNKQITNFKNSALIVPIFYNIAQQNTATTNKLDYTIDTKNTYNVIVNHSQDDVLVLKNKNNQFIPLQQVFKNYVKVTTSELPQKAGNYQVSSKNGSYIQNVSYNYNTTESLLNYSTLFNSKKANYFSSIPVFFNTHKASFKTRYLWKWFLTFALFFVIIEILLLKFLK